MIKNFLTVRSLSNLLDMSEQTTYKLARQGIIPGRVKVGKSVRFNREIVMDWLQKGGVNNDSQN
ncbi:helix-turn-helix domain-containing protein [Priestia aryabhattai]|uniref:helix-turn-helix domain-containing protein n=1 Tax=Priestia aryabhattai TaxID=412384 RepID=UPI003D287EDE